MSHMAHLRKQFNSINTYDYIITLIKRRKNINLMRIYWFFILTNLNPPHPRMHCAKFGWNWLSGSGEEDFLISSMCFHYFVIISPWKRAGLFWTNLNPLHPRMHCAKFGWNWLSGSGEEDFFNFVNVFSLFRNYLPLEKGRALFKKKTWINFTQEFGWNGPMVLEKKMKMWKVYRGTDARTDRQTDDGRQVIRKAHLSFQLRWAKNRCAVFNIFSMEHLKPLNNVERCQTSAARGVLITCYYF